MAASASAGVHEGSEERDGGLTRGGGGGSEDNYGIGFQNSGEFCRGGGVKGKR